MFEELSALIRKFSGCRIAVVGDLMLDSYIWGKVDRISPEAPIPVVRVTRRTSCPGGAANVMRNIVTMGGSVLAFGITGNDQNGQTLLSQLREYGIATDGICADPCRPTTIKQRIIAASQQLLRIDDESTVPVQEGLREQINSQVIRAMEQGKIDVLVMEDYAKGVLIQETAQELTDAANRFHVKTVLDPNPNNRMVLHGLTMMKPNRSEASAMSGIRWEERDEAGLKKAAAKIIADWNVENLVISLAGDGMALFREGGEFLHVPTRAQEVYDVSGAGDTVVAVSSLVIASGGSPKQAVELSNFAAGIAVGKLGTATVSAEELQKLLDDTEKVQHA